MARRIPANRSFVLPNTSIEIGSLDTASSTFWRSANYLSVATLYLRDNLLLKRKLIPQDFKTQVTGHWGCSPGFNAIYAQLLASRVATGFPMRLVVGTGHAGHALLSCLFLSGDLYAIDCKYALNLRGITALSNAIGAPGGLTNELAASYPSVLLPTGELGEALAFAQGLCSAKTSHVTVAVLGDGELETALTQSAWLGVRELERHMADPLLPIINMNGWRMGGRSLFGTMPDQELNTLFAAAGYIATIVHESLGHLRRAIERALREIATGGRRMRPVILFRSPKGWTAPDHMNCRPFAGTAAAHKPVLREPATYPDQASAILGWLKSYHPESLFNDSGIPVSPLAGRSLNQIRRTHTRTINPSDNFTPQGSVAPPPSEGWKTSTDALSDQICHSAGTGGVLVFCPDELTSNGLADLRTVGTESTPVVEVLNEHLCFAWHHGACVAGRRSVCVSYEAFASLFDSLALQLARFLDEAIRLPWRTPHPSINLVLTSLGWHNTPTHHNPALVDSLACRELTSLRIFFPPNPLTAATQMARMLESYDNLNIMVVSKIRLPHAGKVVAPKSDQADGWFLVKDGSPPRLVIVTIGDLVLEEVLAACSSLQQPIVVATCVLAITELTAITNAAAPSLKRFRNCIKRSGTALWVYQGLTRTIEALTQRHALPCDGVIGFRDFVSGSNTRDRLAANGASRNDITAAIKRAFGSRSRHSLHFGF